MKRKKSMSRRAREELVTEIALRYAKAGKKEKGMILDEAVKDTGYNRKYLIAKLRREGKEAGIQEEERCAGEAREAEGIR